MPGPPPKPTRLKLINNNPGHRKLNHREPQPRPGKPTVPDHLSGEAEIEWERLADELASIGVLTSVDRGALAAYCQAWGDLVEAERYMAKNGKVFIARNGHVRVSPYLAIRNKALDNMLHYIRELGLSPASRSRVVVSSKAAEDDPAEKYFGT